MSSENAPLRILVAELINDLGTLVRQELRLAQAEGSEKVSQATAGIVAIIGGLLVATCALLILLQALVLALSEYMNPAWASLLVGVVVALIAFVLIQQGRSSLTPENLAPRRSMRSLQEDTEMVMEKAR